MRKNLAATASADAGHAYESKAGLAGIPFASADQSATAAVITDLPDQYQIQHLTDLLITSDTDLLLTFTEETSDRVVAKIRAVANRTQQFTPRGNWALRVAGKRLKVQASIAGNISILPFYYNAKP